MGHTTVFRAFALACTIGAMGLWGCGSSGGGGGETTAETPAPTPEGYTNITITAGADTSGSTQSFRASLNDLSVLKDATDSATGGAGALAGPTSINDTSSVSCTFIAGNSGLTSGSEDYTVRMSTGAACGNANECITCTLAGIPAARTVTCAGVVPSSAEAAAELVVLQLVCTSTFATNMPADQGMIRFDASQTGDSFSLAGTTTVITGCDGDPDMTAAEITDATWWADTDASFSDAYLLTTVNFLNCVTVHTASVYAELTGVDTPNAAPTNDLGTVTFNAKICDDNNGAVAKGSSVCTAGAP